MTEAFRRGLHDTRLLHRAVPIVIAMLLALIAGCDRRPQQPEVPTVIDPSRVQIVAFVNAASPCQAGTIQLLHSLESDSPARLHVTIVDIDAPEGREQWEDSDLDAIAIVINGSVTVAWGRGESRRTVSFMHPAGFAWVHDDLRAAIAAALAGELQPADPAEAESVRLMNVSVRGQSIRVEDEEDETGQLIIQDQIVLEITASHNDLAPGQRVALAATALSAVLQRAFTPNQLRAIRVDDGTAVMAGEAQVLVATEADVGETESTTEMLAEDWRRAIEAALIEAALRREATPERAPLPRSPAPEATDAGAADPAAALTAPLTPPTP
ncbi:MAG: hypothetical protein ACOX9R_10480 [Armatimonadota bacterium]